MNTHCKPSVYSGYFVFSKTSIKQNVVGTTQTLTFYGETGTHSYGGFACFVIGRQHELVYAEEGEKVLVQLPHAPSQVARMSEENFKKWFRR